GGKIKGADIFLIEEITFTNVLICLSHVFSAENIQLWIITIIEWLLSGVVSYQAISRKFIDAGDIYFFALQTSLLYAFIFRCHDKMEFASPPHPYKCPRHWLERCQTPSSNPKKSIWLISRPVLTFLTSILLISAHAALFHWISGLWRVFKVAIADVMVDTDNTLPYALLVVTLPMHIYFITALIWRFCKLTFYSSKPTSEIIHC
ncbi:hypothetical protein PFISCL1PPCAC_11854, partial [Pristionchus fissidentatus]